MNEKKFVFILGGARSGKSEVAEQAAAGLGGPVTYLATLAAGDEEMRQRIALHRQRRPSNWVTVEETHDIPGEVARLGKGRGVLLVDCLTGWITNLLTDDGVPRPGASDGEKEEYIISRVGELTEAAVNSAASVVMVSNEVGLGLVPAYPVGRLFRDITGRANRMVASRADEVYLVVAGLPVEIKSLAVNIADRGQAQGDRRREQA